MSSTTPSSSASRIIVITGVTRGLGRALAMVFADQGHTVLGCGNTSDGVGRLSAALGAPHKVDRVDVASNDQVAEWSSRLIAREGPPDLLINNAALINRNAPLWMVPADEFRRVVEVNVIGVANVLRNFLPAMIERQHGVIVNLSSYWGRTTSPEVAPYCATKWAIEGLTRSLAQELPKGLAAVAFNPGVIATDMLRSTFGTSAADSHITPEAWATEAAPFLLGLGPEHNGKALTAPGQ